MYTRQMFVYCNGICLTYYRKLQFPMDSQACMFYRRINDKYNKKKTNRMCKVVCALCSLEYASHTNVKLFQTHWTHVANVFEAINKRRSHTTEWDMYARQLNSNVWKSEGDSHITVRNATETVEECKCYGCDGSCANDLCVVLLNTCFC